MQIESIKISNIFSFEYKENIEDCQEIKFNKEDLSLLIGPNGSGKTNFIEIVNNLFSRLICADYSFQEQQIDNALSSGQQGNELNAIYIDRNKKINLNKNLKFTNEDQEIKITISFNDADVENIKFIIDKSEEINQIIDKYSRFDSKDKIENCPKSIPNSLPLVTLTFNSNNWHEPKIGEGKKEEAELLQFLCKEYLKKYNLIKYAIFIGVKYESKQWQLLEETFFFIGAVRNYSFNDKVAYKHSAQNNSFGKLGTANNSYDLKANHSPESIVAELIKFKICYYIKECEKKGAALNEAGSPEKPEKKHKKLKEEIDNLLKPLLAIEFCYEEKGEGNYFFSFKKDNKNIDWDNLSSGQKEIINFIFTIVIAPRNCLIFIDEIELHLHPQIQKKFVTDIKKACQKKKIQLVAATHSSIFVSCDTIGNLYRFYIENEATKVVGNVDIKESKNLARILSYTNSNKIFFADKVILVEGASDEFFYNYFLEWLVDNYNEFSEFKNKNSSIEFIDIGGKGSRSLFNKFLDKYKIKNFYIGDFDNVFNIGIISEDQKKELKEYLLSSLYKKIDEKVLKNKKSLDGKKLSEILYEYINQPNDKNFENLKNISDKIFNTHNPKGLTVVNALKEKGKGLIGKTFEDIEKEINDKYKENIFILKLGELEDYLFSKEIKNENKEIFEKFSTSDSIENWQKELPNNFEEIKNILLEIISS